MNTRKVIEESLLRQEELLIGKDPLTEALKGEIADKIQWIIEEEVTQMLGTESYGRVKDRMGYRHGYKSRTICTSFGEAKVDFPRARLVKGGGSSQEWQSKMLPKYHRRTKAIDDTIISVYLSGANTRRIKRALYPLLKEAALSKSAVSRIVEKLKESFEKWRTKSLSDKTFIYIYADAIRIKVRVAARVVKMSVLAVVGVLENGKKELLALDMRGSESEATWTDVLNSLVTRGLNRPKLVIADGNGGLLNAIEILWPGVDVQRCFVHKLRNLLTHAPEHAHEEVKADYNAIFYAQSLEQAKQFYDAFVKKWSKKHESVATSFLEAGEQLLTFYRYPKTQWKSLRSTNVIERLNLEFRRRVKTQGSFPTEDSVLILLFALYASGQIAMVRLSGFKDLQAVEQKNNLKVVA